MTLDMLGRVVTAAVTDGWWLEPLGHGAGNYAAMVGGRVDLHSLSLGGGVNSEQLSHGIYDMNTPSSRAISRWMMENLACGGVAMCRGGQRNVRPIRIAPTHQYHIGAACK